MATLTLFGYSPAEGFFHRRHPLLKLAALTLLSGSVFKSGSEAAAAGILFLLALFPLCRLRLSLLRPATGFLLFTALLLFGSIPLTGDSFETLLPSRTTDFLRLAFALLLGILFTAVTSPGEIRAALSFPLRPFPAPFSEAVLLLVTFVFTLLPLTFLILEQTRQAQQIRSSGLIRNPLRRMILLAAPFMAHLFIKVDRMSDAAALRCGPYRYRPPELPLTAGDFVLMAGTGLLLRLLRL